MPALLAPLLIWILSSALAKILFSIGIGFMTYTGIQALVEQFLDASTGFLSQLPSEILALLHIAGVDQAISIIGGALLTRAAIQAAKVSVGLST